MTQPWGIDYGSVDGNHSPDTTKLAAAGCEFVWLRGSYSYWDARGGWWSCVPDTCLKRDWSSLSGFVRGAYMFPVLQAKYTPEQQVAVFAAAVRAAGGLRPGVDFPPCLDVEFPGKGIAATGLDRAGVLVWIRRAVTALRSEFGCQPFLYTSGRVWNDSDADCLGNLPAPDLVDCPLWLARYPYKTRILAVLPPPSGLTAPPVPTPWGDAWHAHQYQGDALGVPGMSATVDVDRWRSAQIGDHGGHVAYAQRKLQLTADGVFGPRTEAALRVLQAARGLPTTGILDIRTACSLLWL